VINSNLGLILRRLATVHAWQTDDGWTGNNIDNGLTFKLPA